MIKVYTSKGTVLLQNDDDVRETLKNIIKNEPCYKPGTCVAMVRDDGAPFVAHIDDSMGGVVLESITSLDKESEERITNIFRLCRDRALIAESSHYGI